MESETITMWVTRYALSGGFQECSGRQADGYFYYGRFGIAKIGRDCFPSFEEAKADAESRRLEKLASLQRQIAKLRALKFESPSK